MLPGIDSGSQRIENLVISREQGPLVNIVISLIDGGIQCSRGNHETFLDGSNAIADPEFQSLSSVRSAERSLVRNNILAGNLEVEGFLRSLQLESSVVVGDRLDSSGSGSGISCINLFVIFMIDDLHMPPLIA